MVHVMKSFEDVDIYRNKKLTFDVIKDRFNSYKSSSKILIMINLKKISLLGLLLITTYMLTSFMSTQPMAEYIRNFQKWE